MVNPTVYPHDRRITAISLIGTFLYVSSISIVLSTFHFSICLQKRSRTNDPFALHVVLLARV